MNNISNAPHMPVLLQAVLDGLNVASHLNGLYIDGTVGAGGHASALLEAAPAARLLAFDRDPRSLEIAHATLKRFGEQATLVHGNYNTMQAIAPAQGFEQIDGILLGLGIASMHVDEST